MMMAKDVSQRYQNARDLIEDLEAVQRGASPQYAQPTLDFAKLAEVAKATPSSKPLPQSNTAGSSNDLSTIWLIMFAVSAVINLILIAVLLTK